MGTMHEAMPIISSIQDGCQNPRCPRYKRHGAYAICGGDGCKGYDEDHVVRGGSTMSSEQTTNEAAGQETPRRC